MAKKNDSKKKVSIVTMKIVQALQNPKEKFTSGKDIKDLIQQADIFGGNDFEIENIKVEVENKKR